METLSFEWDAGKAQRNIQKHGVAFEEASTVFGDPFALTIFDEAHSSLGEDRWLTLGKSERNRYLVVVHCERKSRIRILTARLATQKQIRDYEEKAQYRRS